MRLYNNNKMYKNNNNSCTTKLWSRRNLKKVLKDVGTIEIEILLKT